MLLCRGECCVGAVLEHGAVDECGRRASRGQSSIELRRQAPSSIGVELTLEREDVAPQPGQQIETSAKTGVGPLRKMGVEIDEPGHDDQRTQVCVRPSLVLSARRPRLDARQPTGCIDLDQRVVEETSATVRERRQQATSHPVGRLVEQHRDRAYPTLMHGADVTSLGKRSGARVCSRAHARCAGNAGFSSRLRHRRAYRHSRASSP